ncbi:peroxiredoxin [Qipengyuania sp. JC766]|uniref:peroxiredoxin n=1 Tax=Qipengyuania sp. JC766 TaxID=3232139 RepID=UPI003457A0CA
MSKTYEAGDEMPDIAMQGVDGSTIKPSDYRGRKLVLFFYPKDNTPGCTNEAKDFSALKPQFEQAGAAILGISKDSAKKHQNFIAKHGLSVDLATDAQEDGLSDTLGIWTEKQMYGKTFMGMVRTTYLVDEDGRIAGVWPKVKVKDHAADVLEAVEAM